MRATLAALALLVALGCGHQVERGTVRSRNFTPAHEYVETYLSQTICYPVGKVTQCQPIFATRTVWAPDRWSIVVGDAEGESSIDVSRALFDECNEGRLAARTEGVWSCKPQ